VVGWGGGGGGGRGGPAGGGGGGGVGATLAELAGRAVLCCVVLFCAVLCCAVLCVLCQVSDISFASHSIAPVDSDLGLSKGGYHEDHCMLLFSVRLLFLIGSAVQNNRHRTWTAALQAQIAPTPINAFCACPDRRPQRSSNVFHPNSTKM